MEYSYRFYFCAVWCVRSFIMATRMGAGVYRNARLSIVVVTNKFFYFWLHRWMHHPKIFFIVHKVHHDSNITSPWTAFSFHPLEGLLQAIFLPVLLLVMPMQLYVLIIHLTIM